MATMKAVVKTKPELGAVMQDKPIPKPPEADWLVVKAYHRHVKRHSDPTLPQKLHCRHG